MKLGIILNSNDPESVWNALRLGSNALKARNEVRMFLLGSGVEMEKIKSKTFDVAKALSNFIDAGGESSRPAAPVSDLDIRRLKYAPFQPCRIC